MLGHDAGYYAWEICNYEYRDTAYASAEGLNESDATSNATQFELIHKGDKWYLMLREDGGTLKLLIMKQVVVKAIDDTIDGARNDSSSAVSDTLMLPLISLISKIVNIPLASM